MGIGSVEGSERLIDKISSGVSGGSRAIVVDEERNLKEYLLRKGLKTKKFTEYCIKAEV